MLGSDYNVTNFGVSGTTVTSPEIPYFYQPKFEEAKEYLPNIAVIMLGTNDARADHFKSIDYFVADYMELITTIQELESKPEIFLVKPPPIFENILELNNTNLVDEIIPRIEQVANDLNLPIIDVYTVLENHPEYFPDGVHPNSEAAKIIAEEVYEAITTLH